MAKINVSEKKSLEKALWDFKRQCKKEGIIQSCKERRHYTKPSVKRRHAAIKSKRMKRKAY